jgi:hypothetical protein
LDFPKQLQQQPIQIVGPLVSKRDEKEIKAFNNKARKMQQVQANQGSMLSVGNSLVDSVTSGQKNKAKFKLDRQ